MSEEGLNLNGFIEETTKLITSKNAAKNSELYEELWTKIHDRPHLKYAIKFKRDWTKVIIDRLPLELPFSILDGC